MESSDSDVDTDWDIKFLTEVSKKRGKGAEITEQSRCEQMQECLDQGADVDTVGRKGNTALHMAVKRGFREVVRFLRRSRARTDIFNQQNYTAITLAEHLNEEEIASILKDPSKQRSEFTTVDHARLLTSREGQDLSPARITVDEKGPVAKRRLDADDERAEGAKKQRLEPDKPSQLQRHDDPTVGSASGGSSLSGDPRPGSNTERTDQPAPFDGRGTYAASGVKRSLHGVVYQWKHLMLILHRAWKLRYSFRLATEMDSAEKFDDVVLEYEDSPGSRVHRFVQLKHKDDKTDCKMVSATHLLDVKDGDFSMLKYFTSWRKIKENPEFSRSTSKKFILCTNIGLDLEKLKANDIDVNEVQGSDEFLEVTIETKQQPRFYELVDKPSELYDTFKFATDVHSLARDLAKRVCGPKKDLHLNTEIIKRYHAALATEVIDVDNQKFFPKFINNNGLSRKAEKFREIFFFHARKYFPRNAPDTDVWKRLEAYKLNLSKSFAAKVETCTDKELSSKTELPDDSITDGEIADFLKQFILAVNQPNEEELGEMIKLEIGAYSQFNLLNVDFIGDSFESKIVEWLKKTGKYSKFLVNEDADAFFYEIERELSSLITVGLNLPYTAELKKYDIKFEREIGDLRIFLDGSDPNQKPILELMSSKSTLLTALRVYQTLEQLEKYEKNDSLIFIPLEKLLLPDIMNQVFIAFESSRSGDLLVIDCEAIDPNVNTQRLWNRLSNIVADNGAKRMILIIDGNRESVVPFPNGFDTRPEKDDDVSFDNLKERSRDKLMQKTVVRLQGHEEKTSFGSLLHTESIDDIGAKRLTAFGGIIDADTLVQLIKDKEIRIGKEVEGLCEVEDYYISRKIAQVVIKKDILKAEGITDVFALSGIDRQTLERLVANGESQTEIQLNECVLLDSSREKDDFKVQCERNSHRNIHWLQASSGILIWKQTAKDVASLIAYKEASDDIVGPGAIGLAEDNLVNHDEQRKILILSDIAGMGKTTVLKYLAGEMKRSKPGLLVIMIELTRHTVALAEETKKRTFDGNDTRGAVNFLVHKLLSLDHTDMEREAFKAIIGVRGNAALLFDGFDEISPTYENAVIDLLQALKELPIKKLCVTTRLYASEALEKKLGTLSHTLLPFSAADQVEFLTKFWKRELGSNDVDEAIRENLRKHASAVLRILDNSINRQMQEFAGVPLQTWLVAEAFPYEEKGNRHKLPESINLTGLYEGFVDKKYNLIFCKDKKRADPTNPAQSLEDEFMRKILSITHEKLALEALFDGETVRALLRCQPEGDRMCSSFRNINDWIKRTGIVTPVISGKPHFVHRTFAEYFAAMFIIKMLKADKQNQETRKFFVADLFVRLQHRTVRAFLNCFLSDGDALRNALRNESWKLSLREHDDEESSTLYHIAAFEGHIEIVRFFINQLSGEQREADINLRDCSGLTALFITMYNKLYNSDVVKCFVEGGANVNCKCTSGKRLLHFLATKPENFDLVQYVVEKGANVNSSARDGETPLHYAVSARGNFETVKFLVEKGADVHFLANNNKTPLHNAVRCVGNLAVVKHLVEKGANVNSPTKSGDTPLHTAVIHPRNIEVVTYLVENDADVNFQKETGMKTPLHSAVIHAGDSEIVKYLCAQDANVHLKDNNGFTPLYYAVFQAKHLDSVKFLIENCGAQVNVQGEHGNTPLHNAATTAHNFDTVKYLVEKGANVNAEGEHRRTPLHKAAAAPCNFNTVKFLIDNRANIHSEETSGLTPLYYAAGVKDNLDVVKHLIHRGASVNSQRDRGNTPLHSATFTDDNLNTVKYLIEKRADINFQNEFGRTPLHNAVKLPDNSDIVKHLIDKDANVHSRDVNGFTPLYHAAGVEDNLDVVKHLIHRGAIVNSRGVLGDTPLHSAALTDRNLAVVEYLTKNAADVNSLGEHGRTPLHIAVDADANFDVVKHLVDKGADIHSRDADGFTPLYYAAAVFDNLEALQCLIGKGAVADSQGVLGDTPLHKAASRSHSVDSVKYLIENGAKINSVGEHGRTPLHCAAREANNFDVVKCLVEKGADYNSQDSKGWTPLKYASRLKKNLKVVKYLIEIRANNDSSSETGSIDMLNYLTP